MIRSFARPYARAIMEVVPELPKAQALYAQIAQFEQARKSSPELAEVLANPGVSMEQKNRVIDAIASRLEIEPVGVRILHVLAQNHRLNHLAQVLQAWKAMMNERLGVEVAEVSSAHPLSDAEKERLRAALEKKVGKRIELELRTDPSLLAGFVARVGSEIYDASVVGQIQRFQSSIS